MTRDTDEFVTIVEACTRLGIERGQLKRLLRRFGLGQLLQSVPENSVRMRWSDLETLVGREKVRAPRHTARTA